MAAALELRLEPQGGNLVGQRKRDDPAAHGEDVGVVVLPRQTRHIKIVAKRGANGGNLICGDLLPLSAPADDDAAVGASFRHSARDVDADWRIVGGLLVVRAAIINRMPEPRERLLQMLLQSEARVVGPNRDAHAATLYYVRSRFSVQNENAERRTQNGERRTTRSQ